MSQQRLYLNFKRYNAAAQAEKKIVPVKTGPGLDHDTVLTEPVRKKIETKTRAAKSQTSPVLVETSEREERSDMMIDGAGSRGCRAV